MEELVGEVNREPQGQGMVPIDYISDIAETPPILSLETPHASTYGNSAPPVLSPSSLRLPWATHTNTHTHTHKHS